MHRFRITIFPEDGDVPLDDNVALKSGKSMGSTRYGAFTFKHSKKSKLFIKCKPHK
jgi:hypothetical protein